MILFRSIHDKHIFKEIIIEWFFKIDTVVIRLPAIHLPETSSSQTFSSSLTEWSREKADHSVNKLL